MDLTFLGTGSAISLDRAQSGLLLEDENILLDCGSGVFHNIGRSSVSIQDIENVLLTHNHLDHFSDLPSLIKAKKLLGDKKLKIYGPPGTEQTIERFFEIFNYIDVKINSTQYNENSINLDINNINPGDSFRLKGRKIDTIKTHHSIISIGYNFDDLFVYTGDTEPFKEIIGFVDGCDILIHECSFPDELEITNHTRPSDLAKVVKDSDIKYIYLTHFYPHIKGKKEKIKNTINKVFEGKVEIAKDMETIQV